MRTGSLPTTSAFAFAERYNWSRERLAHSDKSSAQQEWWPLKDAWNQNLHRHPNQLQSSWSKPVRYMHLLLIPVHCDDPKNKLVYADWILERQNQVWNIARMCSRDVEQNISMAYLLIVRIGLFLLYFSNWCVQLAQAFIEGMISS